MNCDIIVYEDKLESIPKITTEMILNNYSKAIDVSDLTRGVYLASIRYFLNWLRNNEIDSVNRQVMMDYKRFLVDTYSSASTVNQYLAGVRSLFNYLQTLGVPNVMSTIKSVKQSKNHKKLPLTKAQALKIQDSINTSTLKGKRDYAIYQLCLRNGLRECELLRANVDDLGIIDGENVLYLQGKFHKEKDDYVVLCGTVMSAINDYLHSRGDYKESEPLFIGLATNKMGSRLTTRSIRRILTKMLVDNDCKNKRVTPHSLRHTAITSLTKASGNDLLKSKAFARHSDVNTTTIYIHEDERLKNAPEKLLEAYYNGDSVDDVQED